MDNLGGLFCGLHHSRLAAFHETIVDEECQRSKDEHQGDGGSVDCGLIGDVIGTERIRRVNLDGIGDPVHVGSSSPLFRLTACCLVTAGSTTMVHVVVLKMIKDPIELICSHLLHFIEALVVKIAFTKKGCLPTIQFKRMGIARCLTLRRTQYRSRQKEECS